MSRPAENSPDRHTGAFTVAKTFVRQQCAAGATIELHTYAGVGHFEVRTVAAPDVLAWLLAQLDGAP